MSSDRPPQREAATLLADETFEAWWTRERDKHMVYRAEPWTRYAARAAWDHQRAQVDRLLRVEKAAQAVVTAYYVRVLEDGLGREQADMNLGDAVDRLYWLVGEEDAADNGHVGAHSESATDGR